MNMMGVSGLLKLTGSGVNTMMKSSVTYTQGEPNTVPPSVQVKLYRLVKDLDRTHNFYSGLDLYRQMLTVLNKHFAKLP
jgi:hypothetical protein